MTRSNPERRQTRRLRHCDPSGDGETVIAVELAHNLHHAIDRLEVLRRHCAVGYEQGLVEAAHLKRQELGGRRRRTAGEERADRLAHGALAHAIAVGDLGDRKAAVQEADNARLALGPFLSRRASRRGRAIARYR